MKKLYILLFMGIVTLFVACSTDDSEPIVDNGTGEAVSNQIFYVPSQPDPSFFATADESTELHKLDLSTALSRCVRKASDDVGVALNPALATEEQLEDLSAEVEVIIENATTEKQKLDAIYKWVTTNIKYDTHNEVSDRSAYTTFITQKSNCQGYSNLTNVMCHLAGLACFNANGFLGSQWLGHAWNYAKADGKWYVLDTTNSGMYLMTSTNGYKNLLFPFMVDVTLFEDDNFKYTWLAGHLTVTEVKQASQQLTVPFSINNLRISSFNPQTPLPSQVRAVYLGANILHLGDGNDVGLIINGTNVEAIHVAEANPTFYSENAIVYRRNGSDVQLSLIPPALTWVELSSKLTILDKNAIYKHNAIQTLVIPESVTTIENWAVENAPNLRWIYVPENCVYLGVDSNYNTVEYSEPISTTFVGVHPDCEIIKGAVPTSIKRITL